MPVFLHDFLKTLNWLWIGLISIRNLAEKINDYLPNFLNLQNTRKSVCVQKMIRIFYDY